MILKTEKKTKCVFPNENSKYHDYLIEQFSNKPTPKSTHINMIDSFFFTIVIYLFIFL